MDEEDSLLVKIDTFHFILVFSTVQVGIINCFIQSSRFLKMEATVKSGFFDYDGNLSEDQIRERTDADRLIRIATMTYSFFLAGPILIICLRGPLILGGWSLSLRMWFPFEINSWFRYIAAMAWTCYSVEAAALNTLTFWCVYVTFAYHLITQYKILILAVQEIDNIAASEEASDEKKWTLVSAQTKNCVKHHLILIEFFVDFQTYQNFNLLAYAMNVGLILCVVGYIIMSPDVTVGYLAEVIVMVIGEMIFLSSYCLLGQWITDIAEEVRPAIYGLRWYDMPVAVQKDLLLMMIGCHKTRQVTAMGLYEFSFKGYSELIKAAFSYLNMLNALNGK